MPESEEARKEQDVPQEIIPPPGDGAEVVLMPDQEAKRENPEKVEDDNEKERIDREIFSEKIDRETKELLSSVQSMQKFLSEYSEPVIELPVNTSGKSPDQLKELFEDFLKQANELSEVNKRLDAIIKTSSDMLANLKMENTQEVSALAEIVQNATESSLQSKNNAAQCAQLQKSAQSVYKDYTGALVKERGFETAKDLGKAYREKKQKINSLRSQGLGTGRWFNKKSINDLEAETGKLRQVMEQMGRDISFDRGGMSERERKEIIKNLVEQVADKCTGHYERLLQENPEQKGGDGLIDSKEMDQLHNRYIQTYVYPKIKREEESYKGLIAAGHYEYEEQLANTRDPEKIAQLIAVIKRGYSQEYNAANWTSPEYNPTDWEGQEARRKEFQQEVNALPEGLGGIAFSSYINTQGAPVNKEFEKLADFVARYGSDNDRRSVVKRSYNQVLQTLVSTPNGNLPYGMRDRLNKRLEQPADKFEMEKFLLGFDMDRWEVFKTDDLMSARFGRESLSSADQEIGYGIKAEILQLPEQTDNCINLGYKLYHFKKSEYVPLAILNAYREHGQFISFQSSGDKTVLYKYLTSLDSEEIQKLKSENIPGCNESIDLILSHLADFDKPVIYGIKDKETGEEQKEKDNYAYHEIQQNLGRMAVHFLEHGEHKMDFYLMGLLDDPKADIGEGNELIAQVLCHAPDRKTQEAALKCVTERINRGDEGTALSLIKNYDALPEAVKKELPKKAGNLIYGLSALDKVDDRVISGLGRMLDRSPEEVTSLVDFLKFLRGDYYHRDVDEKNINDFFEGASNPDVVNFCKRFNAYGYKFYTEHMSVLPELISKQELLAQDIEEIRKIFPQFRYDFFHNFEYNQATKQTETIYMTNPFDCLMKQKAAEDIFLTMAGVLEKEGSFRKEFSDGLLRNLRADDPVLQRDKKEPSADAQSAFYEGFQNIIREVYGPDGKLKDFADLFQSKDLLHFIARQPERINEVLSLPEAVPDLFNLLKPGGSLYANKENIFRTIFENGDAVRKAKMIASVFSRKTPYWKSLYLFTESRIGEKLAGATSNYPVTEVAGVQLEKIVHRHILAKQKDPDAKTRLGAMIPDANVVEQLTSGSITEVPFSQFAGMYKKLIFRDYLQKTIETSRSDQAKLTSDSRNRSLAFDQLSIAPGTYIHGSRVDFMDSVMLNGNLPQEALGEKAGTDSYPFQVDFTKLAANYLEKQKNIPDVFDHSISANYGSGGPLGRSGQIFYLYDRSKSNWEKGKDYGANSDHALILGGIPSTEITGIVLRDKDATLTKVKQSILEFGCYIPVYDIDGKLLLAQNEYDQVRGDDNLKIPVEVWDYSLKSGGQLGSNSGGEFTVPEKSGSEKYYVKFKTDASADALWNEQLADNFYRAADLDVPDTKVVKIEGSFGHASRLLAESHEPNPEEYHSLLKAGFIMDCWLANWDAAAKPDNVRVDNKTGHLYRIDNGGALLFRARGERKSNFGSIVTELETMKGNYPGISKKEIDRQLKNLKKVFTDKTIERSVDGVRLSHKDRDLLKNALRERRDYIISYFEGETGGERKKITEEAKEAVRLLRSKEINDERLSSIVPEWEKVSGEAGYQHNGVRLGGHIKEAIVKLHTLAKYRQLDLKEQELATLATLFHDIAKPTGTQDEQVARDFDHEIPSAQIAATYMAKWGYPRKDISSVVDAILNDGVVSDIARGKVRDQSKTLTPEQLRKKLTNPRTTRILRVLNQADVLATVGKSGFEAIKKAYNEYFDRIG